MGKDISPLHVVQTCCGTHPTAYPMSTGGKWPGREADHSPLTNAKVTYGTAPCQPSQKPHNTSQPGKAEIALHSGRILLKAPYDRERHLWR
jgi:hypothetical protein